MKKKLFLMLALVCALSCLFILSVSANAVVSEKNIDESGDVFANYLGDYTIDNSSQNISSIDISYKTESGATKEGKLYFATNLWGSNRQIHSTYIPADFDMSQTVYMPDKIDINGDGSYNETIKGTQGDKNLYFKYSSYNEGVFSDTVDVKNQLVKLSYSKYLEYFGPAAYAKLALTTVTYNGKEAVEGTFFVSPRITSFHGGSFGGSANGNINGETGKFTRLVFEERTGSVNFDQYCFCRNVIEEVVFLRGTYNLRNDAIAYLWKEGTNTPCLKRVVVESGAVLSSTISWNVGTYDVVFIGDEANYSADEFSSCLVNATGNVSFEKICYVYGHTVENDNDCTTALACEDCGLVLEDAYDKHDEKVTIEYKDGYSSVGCRNVICARCDYAVSVEAPALFVCLGYSASESGSAGLILAYKVNHEAIENYKAETNSALEYGMFAVLKSNIGENGILNADGSENAGVIKADLTKNQFAVVSIKVKGFTTDEQKDAQIALGLYVIVDGEEKEISYCQSGTPTEGEKFTSTSYNEQAPVAE